MPRRVRIVPNYRPKRTLPARAARVPVHTVRMLEQLTGTAAARLTESAAWRHGGVKRCRPLVESVRGSGASTPVDVTDSKSRAQVSNATTRRSAPTEATAALPISSVPTRFLAAIARTRPLSEAISLATPTSTSWSMRSIRCSVRSARPTFALTGVVSAGNVIEGDANHRIRRRRAATHRLSPFFPGTFPDHAPPHRFSEQSTDGESQPTAAHAPESTLTRSSILMSEATSMVFPSPYPLPHALLRNGRR
ncbi:hypothetical protein ABIA65_000158 [Mycolicibacterium sp. 624]